MDTQPVIELTEAQLDEVFGGGANAVCDQTAVSPCAICVGD
jgi:hypothetical protein